MHIYPKEFEVLNEKKAIITFSITDKEMVELAQALHMAGDSYDVPKVDSTVRIDIQRIVQAQRKTRGIARNSVQVVRCDLHEHLPLADGRRKAVRPHGFGITRRSVSVCHTQFGCVRTIDIIPG